MTIEQIRIRQKRIELRKTQKEMADMLGISQQAYQQLETGRTTDMRISTLKRLCTIFNITSDWLLGLDGKGEIMKADLKALDALNCIHEMEFTSYNDFLQKAIAEGKLIKIKNALGELHMYRIVCEICGEEPDEKYEETLSY